MRCTLLDSLTRVRSHDPVRNAGSAGSSDRACGIVHATIAPYRCGCRCRSPRKICGQERTTMALFLVSVAFALFVSFCCSFMKPFC